MQHLLKKKTAKLSSRVIASVNIPAVYTCVLHRYVYINSQSPTHTGGFYTSRKVVPWPPAVLNIGKHCRGLLSRDSRTNYTPVRALITRAARACTPLPRELFRLGAGSPPARARNNSLRLPLRLLASRFAPSRFDEYTALVVVFRATNIANFLKRKYLRERGASVLRVKKV